MQVFKYIVLLLAFVANAQPGYKISGRFAGAAQKDVMLKGYTFSGEPVLAQTRTDNSGNFSLQYPEYKGAALLEIKGMQGVIVLLNKENFEMYWSNLKDFSTLTFKNSPENDAFAKGLAVYRDAEFKRTGLHYLIPAYKEEPGKQQLFINELGLQDKAMDQFFKTLPATSYARYYLDIRRLIADFPLTAGRYSERLASNEKDFTNLDFTDSRLVKSGLYKELLSAYAMLMESYGEQMDTHLNRSTDAMLASLSKDPSLKQEVAEYWFKLLEERSLFSAAEHLAKAMLSDTDCQLSAEREALFEQYRKMGVGNTAPDIIFSNATGPAKNLSTIIAKYKLVVFGAGWCPKCAEEIPKLTSFYKDWKTKYNLEIVFISLDTDKAANTDFSKNFPWITSVDYKGWESRPARDYYIIGTPAMYLLDKENKILLKPISPEQVNAWLEFKGK